MAGLVAIPVVLGARLVAVGIPVRLLARSRQFAPHTVKILAWAGLRGGISVALALSLRSWLPGATADVLLVMTYVVVVFSVVVQGLTMKGVATLPRHVTPGARRRRIGCAASTGSVPAAGRQ